MQRSRRTILAALPVALAGCGRSFRQNSVPGGLYIQNSRQRAVTVSVRATLLPPKETSVSRGPTEAATATPTPETPPGDALESPTKTGEYDVGAGENHGVPGFFEEAGRWVVEATVGNDGGNRTRIKLYTAIPGPTGADTVHIRVRPGNVTAEATTVD